MRTLGWALVASALLGACDASTGIVAVDLHTDLVPGIEFVAVRTSIREPARSVERAALGDQSYLEPRRVAELDDVPSGARRVRVSLLAASGEVVAQREVQVQLERGSVVTVLVTRDCRDVRCDEGGEAPTSCVGGRCVPLACATGAEPECPEPACISGADCAPRAACAAPECVESVCLYRADDTQCATDLEYCDPDLGCRPAAMLADAGPADAGPRDAGAPDAGSSDAGSPDAGSPDAGPPIGPIQLGSPADDVGNAIAVDAAGEIYLAGSTTGSIWEGPHQGNGDVLLVKLGPDGTLRWARTLATGAADEARGVALGPGDDVVYVVGITAGNLAGPTLGATDLFLAAFDADGTERWVRQEGTAGNDYGFAVGVDAAGFAMVVGSTDGAFDTSGAGPTDYFVMRFDPSGARQWVQQDGTDQPERAHAVAVDAAGHAFVVGETSGAFAGATAGNQDVLVMRYEASGARAWAHQRGTVGSDIALGVALAPDGELYVTGGTTGALDGASPSGGVDGFVQRWSPDGTWRWTRLFGTAAGDTGAAACAGQRGMESLAFVAGSAGGDLHGELGAGGSDVALLAFDSAGERAFTRLLGTAGPDSARGCGFHAASRTVLVLGNTSAALGASHVGGIDLVVARWDTSGLPR